MAPAPLNPRVARAIYRGLLRSSRYGRYPEVFGEYGAVCPPSVWFTPIVASSSDDDDGNGVGRGGDGSTPRKEEEDDDEESPRWARTRRRLDVNRLPATPAEVRSNLRAAFEYSASPPAAAPQTPLSQQSSSQSSSQPSTPRVDPFAVLRTARDRSTIICPRLGGIDVPETLPIFDYTSSALVPGEETSFNFFEPRYKRLAELATSDSGRGYFLLRASYGGPPSPPSRRKNTGFGERRSAILLKINEQLPLPDGNIAIRCEAGPRIQVLQEDSVPVMVDGEDMPPLARAIQFEFLRDEENDAPEMSSLVATLVGTDDDAKKAKEEEAVEGYGDCGASHHSNDIHELKNATAAQQMRRRLLHCINGAADLGKIIERTGLPPVDVERFSFWSLRFVLAPGDASSRLRWLYRCQDSLVRMTYVVEFLEQYRDIAGGGNDGGGDGSDDVTKDGGDDDSDDDDSDDDSDSDSDDGDNSAKKNEDGGEK